MLSLQGDSGLGGCAEDVNESANRSENRGEMDRRAISTGDASACGEEVESRDTDDQKKRRKVAHCEGRGDGVSDSQSNQRGRAGESRDSRRGMEGGKGVMPGKRGVLPNIMQLRQICDFADFDLPSGDGDINSNGEGDKDRGVRDDTTLTGGSAGSSVKAPMGEYVTVLLEHSAKLKVSQHSHPSLPVLYVHCPHCPLCTLPFYGSSQLLSNLISSCV